jgi:DNA transformation protein
MPSAPDPFVDHCLELLGPLGVPRARRMFGGHGVYLDDLFIGLVDKDQLYLKVDALTRADFEAAGCRPFVYDAGGKPMTMGYFSAPDAALEAPAQMQPWARLALEAALRARASKPAPARRKPAAEPVAPQARVRKAAVRKPRHSI